MFYNHSCLLPSFLIMAQRVCSYPWSPLRESRPTTGQNSASIELSVEHKILITNISKHLSGIRQNRVLGNGAAWSEISTPSHKHTQRDNTCGLSPQPIICSTSERINVPVAFQDFKYTICRHQICQPIEPFTRLKINILVSTYMTIYVIYVVSMWWSA